MTIFWAHPWHLSFGPHLHKLPLSTFQKVSFLHSHFIIGEVSNDLQSNQPRHQWKLYWEVLTAELSTIQDKRWWNFKPKEDHTPPSKDIHAW
jgi:hypothetical protein